MESKVRYAWVKRAKTIKVLLWKLKKDHALSIASQCHTHLTKILKRTISNAFMINLNFLKVLVVTPSTRLFLKTPVKVAEMKLSLIWRQYPPEKVKSPPSLWTYSRSACIPSMNKKKRRLACLNRMLQASSNPSPPWRPPLELILSKITMKTASLTQLTPVKSQKLKIFKRVKCVKSLQVTSWLTFTQTPIIWRISKNQRTLAIDW